MQLNMYVPSGTVVVSKGTNGNPPASKVCAPISLFVGTKAPLLASPYSTNCIVTLVGWGNPSKVWYVPLIVIVPRTADACADDARTVPLTARLNKIQFCTLIGGNGGVT